MREPLKLCVRCGKKFQGKGILGFYYCSNCKTIHHISKYDEKKGCTVIRSYNLSNRPFNMMNNSFISSD